MPKSVRWHNQDKTILFEIYEGMIDMKEFTEMVDEAFQLVSEQNHTVHIIADLTQVRTVPTNPIMGAKYADRRTADNQGIVVYVNANAFVQSIIRVAKTVGSNSVRNLYFAKSIPEAEELIRTKQVL